MAERCLVALEIAEAFPGVQLKVQPVRPDSATESQIKRSWQSMHHMPTPAALAKLRKSELSSGFVGARRQSESQPRAGWSKDENHQSAVFECAWGRQTPRF
jgi:hypothetical protein